MVRRGLLVIRLLVQLGGLVGRGGLPGWRLLMWRRMWRLRARRRLVVWGGLMVDWRGGLQIVWRWRRCGLQLRRLHLQGPVRVSPCCRANAGQLLGVKGQVCADGKMAWHSRAVDYETLKTARHLPPTPSYKPTPCRPSSGEGSAPVGRS